MLPLDRPTPKVSVSITTYNHRRFIGPCLDSVLAQVTSFPVEIVVGDDCSTDGTSEIVREYVARHPDRIVALYHDRNVGIRQNWQDVLDACTGEYIAHLDGDDLMYPGKLQKQVDYLDRHPDIVACFHNMRVIDHEGNTLYYFTEPGSRAVMGVEEVVRDGPPYAHSSKVYRRSALPAGGLDRSVNLLTDWLVHVENAHHGGLAYIDEVLGEYRRHSGALTMGDAYAAERLLPDLLKTVRRGGELGAAPASVRAAEARLYYSVALRHLLSKNWKKYRSLIQESVGSGRPFVGVAHRILFHARFVPHAVRALAMLYHRFSVIPRIERRWPPR